MEMLQKQEFPCKWKQDLFKDIRTNSEKDDICDPLGFGLPFSDMLRRPVSGNEFSPLNHEALQKAIDACNPSAKFFLEIGVNRNGRASSTHTIIKNIPSDGKFLGVDIDQKDSAEKNNFYFLQSNSRDYNTVVNHLTSLGVTYLDFIHIDAIHSINQVLYDWEYTRLLRRGGVVGFHDVTAHPGPNSFIKAINTDKWIVVDNLCPDDYGFGYCILK
jgi:hypothetical protein